MSFDISTLTVRGPAKVTFGGQTFWSAGDVNAKPALDLYPIKTAFGGDLSRRMKSVVWDISFTPVGEWTSDLLAVTHPYGAPVVGTSFRTSSDRDLVVHGTDGQKITFHAAGVWKQPDLILSPDESAFGEITFRAIGANNKSWSDAAKFYTIASETFSGAGPTLSSVITQGWSVAWGATSIRAEGAIRLSFGASWKERTVNGDAIVDYTLKGDGLECSAKFIPANMTLANYLAMIKMQNTGAAPGADMVTLSAADLVITGLTAAWVVTLKSAIPIDAAALWGEDPLRTGEVNFLATRAAYNGALFTIAAPAAP